MSLHYGSVIVGGARTPMGRLQGSLSSLTAADLDGGIGMAELCGGAGQGDAFIIQVPPA